MLHLLACPFVPPIVIEHQGPGAICQLCGVRLDGIAVVIEVQLVGGTRIKVGLSGKLHCWLRKHTYYFESKSHRPLGFEFRSSDNRTPVFAVFAIGWNKFQPKLLPRAD